MDVAKMKQEYNMYLKRCYKGMEYLDSKDVSDVEKDNKLPPFKRILEILNSILFDFKKNGIQYTDDEILNGFNLESEVMIK